MIGWIVTFAVLVIVILVLWYLLSQLPLPPPAMKFVEIAIVVLVAIVVIWFLLAIGGLAPVPKLPGLR